MPFSMSGNSNWSYNRFDAYEAQYKKTEEPKAEAEVVEEETLEEGSCGSKGYQEGGEVKCDKCEGKGCDHCEGKGYHEMTQEDKDAYEKFFQAALKKFGVDSPADFKSDEEKKKFFNYVDKNYKGENEKAEEVKEETLAMKAAKHITDMWTEASKKDEVKDEEKEKKEEKHDGKTMTGKPANKIDVTPTTDEEKDK